MKLFIQLDRTPKMILMLSTNEQISKEPGEPWTYSCVRAYSLNIVLKLFFSLFLFGISVS